MPASHDNDVDDDVDDNDVDDGDLMRRDAQEHLGADDEAAAGLQDADEEAGAGSNHHHFSFHRPCLETHKRLFWLLLSFENRDNVLPEAFMTSRKFIIVFVLTILRREVVGLGGL